MTGTVDSSYRLKDPDRGLIGPVTLETVCELVAAGVVHAEATISCDDDEFVYLSDCEELTAALEGRAALAGSFRGTLGKRTVISALHRIHAEEATGLLVVQDGDLRKDAYFQDGKLVFLSSNIPTDRFGEFLVSQGMITADDLGVALESMHTDNNRLGDTLVRLGLLEPEQLATELRRHQIGRMIELCCWRSGDYTYFHGREYSSDEPSLRIALPKLVMIVARDMPESMLEPHLDLDRVPTLIPDSGRDQLILLEEDEKRLIATIDGKRTGKEIVALAVDGGLQRRTALMVLFLLHEVAAIEFI